MFRLRTLLCHLGAMASGVVSAAQPGPRLYINYSPAPPPKDLLTYDLCILDPHARADLRPGQALGHHFMAYLSLVELAKGSQAEAAALKREVPFVGKNEAWASRVMDVTSDRWREFVFEDVAVPAIEKGYDGFFLDTADATASPAFKFPAQARKAVVDIIRALRLRWPGKRIIINRGFELLHELGPVVDGVLVESVFQSFDPATKHYRAVPAEGTAWVVARIRDAQAQKLKVYAVDYVAPANRKLALETMKQLQSLNCVALITTPELNGQVLAPKP